MQCAVESIMVGWYIQEVLYDSGNISTMKNTSDEDSEFTFWWLLSCLTKF